MSFNPKIRTYYINTSGADFRECVGFRAALKEIRWLQDNNRSVYGICTDGCEGGGGYDGTHPCHDHKETEQYWFYQLTGEDM